MEFRVSKLIAAALGVAFILIGRRLDLAGWEMRLLIALVVSQFLIWFPEELGSMKGGSYRGRRVDRESPGCAVAGLGWTLLLGVPIFYFLVIRGFPRD